MSTSPVPADVIQDFVNAVADGLIRPPIRVACAEETAEHLRGIAEEVTAVGTELLDQAVFQTWPELQGAKA